MTTGHLHLFGALLSFSLLGVLHKMADVKKCSPSAITALIYAWSVLFVSVGTLMTTQQVTNVPAQAVWIGIPFGISSAVAILAFQAGIRHGKIATSWLAINLSSGVPTVASILIYSEKVTPMKAFALLLIPVAMLLLWQDKRAGERSVKA
jgi:EamA domain-containing membrane protein RarD